MRDLYDGRSFTVQLAEELHDLLGLTGVQIAGRLIGQEQRRLVNDGARDSYELLLAPESWLG